MIVEAKSSEDRGEDDKENNFGEGSHLGRQNLKKEQVNNTEKRKRKSNE